MSRLLWVGTVAFILVAVLGIGAVAQDSRGDRITPGKRVVAYPSFEFDVLVDGRPLSEYHARDKTYVEAVEGAEYEVRLRNSSPYRVAVALSVDGLNTIDARQTSAWNSSKWVIDPYQTITISGWQMSSERARRFYFTTERDSYAGKLGRTANLGVISAVFFRERGRVVPFTRPNEQSSTDEQSSSSAEPKLSGKAARDSRAAATGIGRSVRNDVSFVDMDLESRPAAELTLRYEYSGGRFCPEPRN